MSGWLRQVLAGALALASPRFAASLEPAAPNLVLVTVEGLRADHLGCAGWPYARTRALDRMAAVGVRFAVCDTASPSSRPSHATILTGLFPPHHGVRDDGDVLAADVPAVAERLAAAGYATAAVVGASTLRRHSGLARGFATLDDEVFAGGAWPLAPGVRGAAAVAERGLALLDALPGPYFLWLHFADVVAHRSSPSVSGANRGPTPEYDAAVAVVDAEISRVLRAVGRDTFVILVGSFGEMLGEHGEQGHGLLPLRGARRVPLLLSGPDLPGGSVERCLVRTADVAPTLLALAGAAPLAGIDGESLLPLPSRFGRCGRRSFCEAFAPYPAYGWFPLQVVGDHRWTWVQGPERGALYDARRDPLERRDLVASRGREASGLRSALSRVMAGAAVAAWPSALPDPRLEVAAHATLEQAARLAGDGACDQALIALEPLLAEASRNAVAMQLAGSCELALGAPERALPWWQRAATLRPDDAGAQAGLGRSLLEAGRPAEAAEALRRALTLDPADGRSAARLAALLRERSEAALVILDEAEAAGAGAPDVYLERGLIRVVRGELEAALGDFGEAARRDPGDPAPLEHGARAAVGAGRFEAAADFYERWLELEPDRGEVWQALGSIYLEPLRRREAALRCFRQALRLATDEAQRKALSEVVEKLSR